jgi:hypothetical protein
VIIAFFNNEFKWLSFFSLVLSSRNLRVLFFGLFPGLHYSILFFNIFVIRINESFMCRTPIYSRCRLLINNIALNLLFFLILIVIFIYYGNFIRYHLFLSRYLWLFKLSLSCGSIYVSLRFLTWRNSCWCTWLFLETPTEFLGSLLFIFNGVFILLYSLSHYLNTRTSVCI